MVNGLYATLPRRNTVPRLTVRVLAPTLLEPTIKSKKVVQPFPDFFQNLSFSIISFSLSPHHPPGLRKVCMHVGTHEYSEFLCTFVDVCMPAPRTYVCMHVCVYACMYVCISEYL